MAKQEAEFKGLARELKLNGMDDEETDPELAALNKQLKKQGKASTFSSCRAACE